MKFFKTLCMLLLVSFLCSILSACHNPPTWFWDSTSYDLTEDKLKSIHKSIDDFKGSGYYMSITENFGERKSEEVYISGESAIWYMDDIGDRFAYIDGYKYTNTQDSSSVEKEVMDFDINNYSEKYEQSYKVLKTILCTGIENFEVNGAVTTEYDDCIGVCLEYKGSADDPILKDEISGFQNSNLIIIQFDYDSEKDKYSNFIISWGTVEYSYYVMFELEECPESLATTVKSVIDGVSE